MSFNHQVLCTGRQVCIIFQLEVTDDQLLFSLSDPGLSFFKQGESRPLSKGVLEAGPGEQRKDLWSGMLRLRLSKETLDLPSALAGSGRVILLKS